MLEKMNVYNELSGITTNQSEGYNTLLKHYGHWKEAPLDVLILDLYQLRVFITMKFKGGTVEWVAIPFLMILCMHCFKDQKYLIIDE